jgi:hypothetical protein
MAVHDEHTGQRSYQHEKLTTVVRGLMGLGTPTSQQLAVVIHELMLAFRHAPPPGAEPSWEKIRPLIPGGSSLAVQANRLTEAQVHELLDAVLDLYDATARAYYTTQQA